MARRTRFALLLGLIVLLLGAVVIFASGAFKNSSASASESPVAPEVKTVPLIGEGDQLLVWTAPAVLPDTQAANATGDVALVDSAGNVVPVVKVPDGANRVIACGANALSPDGRHFAFFMGVDSNQGGEIFLMTDGGTPTPIDKVQYLACQGGNGRFNFSPDSSRYAYIAYESDARQSEFADGTLRVGSTSDYSVAFEERNVTSFDITDEGVGYLQFFTNEKREADEAAIAFWDGSSAREITAFNVAEGCRYTSGYIKVGPNGHLWVVIRELCRDRNEWQLYDVNPEDRSVLVVLKEEPRGASVSYAETNNIIFSPDGETMFYTLPDGVGANSVTLYAAPASDFAAKKVVINGKARFRTYGGSVNANPVISPDKNWLAVVSDDGNSNYKLHIVNLANPDAAPLEVEAGSRGDSITFVQFTADSSRLIYTAGGVNGADNSLFAMELSSGSAFRIQRGNFTGWAAVSPAGDEVAILDYQIQAEGIRGPDFVNLEVINVDSGETTTLLTGGEVIDGEVKNTKFFAPFLWLK
ncbi:MAG: hypothetical protein KJ064_18670 [Anaerolineae bacterium]|nr:hypothetical protein [Anaerolineae bacterium]